MSGLPAWLAPLSDAERCREADSWAIGERGVPSLTLMENASQGVARLVQETVPAGRVVVVCGGGNNGGDGYATARILRSMGREVVVLEAADPGKLSPDAAAQRAALPGPQPAAFSAEWLEGAAVVVDALLGTGFTGKPRGTVGKAIKAIAASGITVVSVDVPSGIDASTGEAGGDFITAFATATFHFDKVGLHVNPGRDAAGFVRVLEIGIPEGAPVEPASVGLIDDAGVLGLVPRRGPRSNKFTSGHVYVAGGSVGLTGATVLASRAAARAGAGYVTACVPASEQPVVAS
ncbi:MAG: NAD(P)H-hydrate epimerase, partial [Solirubrobacterales bacterium]